MIGEIVQAPSKGEYSKVAQSSLKVAAALAPALFLLRLALYHWGRLLGEDDSAMRVIGDWVTAGALAVASGPFLDLVIRLGWWMVGRVIGETGGLAVNFVKSTTATSVVIGMASQTFLGGLVTIGLSIGSLIAIGGMLFAFASCQCRPVYPGGSGSASCRGQCATPGALAAFSVDEGCHPDCLTSHRCRRSFQGRAGSQFCLQ